MRRLGLLSLAGLLVLVVVAGCDSKPTHESLAQEAIEKMKEMVSVLEGITDEASAQAAKPKLQAIDAGMKELKAKSDKLEKLDAAEEKRLQEKYEPQMKEVGEKLVKEMFRIGFDPKLGPILKDAMPDGPTL